MQFLLLSLRVLLLLIGWTGLVFTAIWVFVGTHQSFKNLRINRDFKAAVSCVQDFRSVTGKLPTDIELAMLTAKLPVREHRFNYEVNSTLSLVPQPAGGELNNTVWTLSFWRGEWAEYYLSWNGYNSLDWQSSWLLFCGLQSLPTLFLSWACLAGARWLRRRSPS
ncbi:MAG: hypothetical protein DWH81_08735 [Planctomycetota bacterium]|nr:MAG: hypothetical protein DWH81_08735 [Planctomycetota bacterium]